MQTLETSIKKSLFDLMFPFLSPHWLLLR